MKRLLVGLTAAALLAATASSVDATIFTLTDLNSIFKIDGGPDLEPLQWEVDGVQQLHQQGFWVRRGTTGPEQRLGEFFTSGQLLAPNIAQLQFNEHPKFDVQVTYVLTGGALGSGMSDMAETIRIHNTTTSTLNFHFFQYADFDLGGTPGDDALSFPNANAVSQRDMGSGTMLSETVVTPIPTHHEGDSFPDLRDKLDDQVPTTLDDLPAIGGAVVTGDVAWAFQWDVMIAAGGTMIISKDKLLTSVPEPGSLMLLGMGLVGAGIASWRRKKSS